MSKFTIRAIEFYSRLHVVEANSVDEAIDKLATEYENDKIEPMGDMCYYDGMDFIDNTSERDYLVNKGEQLLDAFDYSAQDLANSKAMGVRESILANQEEYNEARKALMDYITLLENK